MEPYSTTTIPRSPHYLSPWVWKPLYGCLTYIYSYLLKQIYNECLELLLFKRSPLDIHLSLLLLTTAIERTLRDVCDFYLLALIVSMVTMMYYIIGVYPCIKRSE